MADLLPILYQQMAEMTAPLCGSGSLECAQFCQKKYRCCEKQYCEATAKFAREKYGVELQPTGNPDLPFMGEHGCTVAPHLRPICTLHVCSISWAAKSSIENDEQKTKAYFDLRDRILAEARREGKMFE